jgi:hypothetical protein
MPLAKNEQDRHDQPSDHPRLGEYGRLLARTIRLGIHTAMPGAVVAVTPAAGGKPATVDVQPGLMIVRLLPDGTELPEPLPLVPACPVGVFALGGMKISVLPQPGDQGLLLASERSIEAWYRAAGAPTIPPFDHTHSLSDAFYLPAFRAGPDVVQLDASLRVGTDTGAPAGTELGELVIDPAGLVTLRSATSVALEAPAVQLMSGAPLGQFLTTLHTILTAWTPTGVLGDAVALKAALAPWLALLPPGPP